eukprot:COSAG01_NODE_11320_length_1959_cov_1.891398_1_plen_80_part_10
MTEQRLPPRQQPSEGVAPRLSSSSTTSGLRLCTAASSAVRPSTPELWCGETASIRAPAASASLTALRSPSAAQMPDAERA